MLYHFQSQACPEILMLAAPATALLRAMGKDAHARQGIFTTELLPTAIADLRKMMAQVREQEEAQSLASEAQEKNEAQEQDLPQPSITLAARAQPLLEMLERSLLEHLPVTWLAE